MKTLTKVALCAVVLTIAMFLFLQKRTTSRHPAQKETATSQTMRTTTPVAPPSNDAPAASANPAPVATTQPDEPAATRQMYAAHAPLRTPELADPDSEANRQILQTMVQKALQRRAADASANIPDSIQ
jgi:hypothetical protein